MEKYKSLFVPGSILGAGVIIAISVFATGGLNIPIQQGLPAQVGSQDGEKQALGPELYQKLAKQLGVNMSQFNDCIAQRKYKDKVENDLREGANLGVDGTPGSFVNSAVAKGALPYNEKSPEYRAGMQTLKSIIEAELASKNSSLLEGLSITEKDHIRGNPNAQITIVEFSDFQCPFCRRFHPTVQQALAEYGDQIRWVYKHFPLDQLHPQARPAAEASECIAEQKGNDGFWQFADEVFKSQES